MAVRLRLKRMGRKKRPFYRVVAADSRFPRDGRHLEVLGHYNPMPQPHMVKLELDRIDYWISVGAKPSDTVAALIKQVRCEVGGDEKAAAVESEAPAVESEAPAVESEDSAAEATE